MACACLTKGKWYSCYGPSEIAWPVLGGLASRPSCELLGLGLALPRADETDQARAWGGTGGGGGSDQRRSRNVGVGWVGELSGEDWREVKASLEFAAAPRKSHGLRLVAPSRLRDLISGRPFCELMGLGLALSNARGRGRAWGVSSPDLVAGERWLTDAIESREG
jgi:hypothetical protein